MPECATSARRAASSGIGREGVHEGLSPFLEVKFMILEGHLEGYENTAPA
jgi:hypothetical protein